MWIRISIKVMRIRITDFKCDGTARIRIRIEVKSCIRIRKGQVLALPNACVSWDPSPRAWASVPRHTGIHPPRPF
jgi:hypothetical protein